ncbi:MAG: helix-turn-helix domain-containing protein [Treponema sp.]|jgi:transcriptional regulator with XRE-family HTH domain|nr:helix-turn-helix domain-containing protein [Treponema sp.]
MKTKLRHILAANIRNHRNLLGYSQVKLAEIANIAPSYLATIELEKNFPSDEVLERIARALKIDPVELFSMTCYPVEELRTFHKSVLEAYEQTLKNQITKFFESKTKKP